MTIEDGKFHSDVRESGRILLVDDEESIRKLIADILERQGFTVTQCCDGGQAVAYYSLHPAEIDLVVMDVMMPGINGLEALVRILRVNPDAKVVMISGGGYSEDDIRNAGATDFASKPFKMPQLLEMVKRHIRRKNRATPHFADHSA